MTYTLPGAVIAAALIMLIAAATAAALAITGSGILKHPGQADSREPGPGPEPAPGPTVPPSKTQGTPALQAPAPDGHGTIDYTLTVWACGRIRMYDGHGRLAGTRDCDQHIDWDAELRAEVERRQP